MKKTLLTTLAFLSLSLTLHAQDCTQATKAQIARDNMDEGDDGLTCANAAKFYVKLCQYKTKPLTPEQGTMLKKELKSIKKAYNDYGIYCKDIGKINDKIPDSPTITLDQSEEETTSEEVLLEAVSNVSGSGNNGNRTTGSGDCNFAARNKFGANAFSNSGAENAANQYEGYRCHCINGTLQDGFTDPSFDPKPLDTKKALQQIKRLRQNYYNMKGPGDPGLSPLPSRCADSPSGAVGEGNAEGGPKSLGKQNFGEIMAGDQLSNEMAAFVNELASISSNPRIKRLSQDMNAVQQKYDNVESGVQEIANMFGGSIDQETRSMMNFYQNAEMIVAIGKAIFGKEPSLEERLSDSQLAVRRNMLDIGKSLRTMYDEVNAIEPYKDADKAYLTRLDKSEQRIAQYNALTSRERYFYLWYLNFDGYPNIADYNAELDNVQQLTINQLLQRIAKLQQKYDMNKRKHIANKNIAFSGAQNQIQLYKMRYYKAIGRDDLAAHAKAALTFDNVPIGETVKLIIESFNQKEYYAAAGYGYIVQDYFQNEEVMQLYYKNIPGLPEKFEYSDDGIDRGEISILMMLGVISAVESGQISMAQNGLAVLTEFHNNTVDWSERKSRGGRRKRASQDAVKNVLAMHLTKSHLALNTASAYVNLGLENYDKVLKNVADARHYLTITSGTASGIPENLFHKLKTTAYLGLQDYESAKETFRDWNSMQSAVNAIYYTGDGAIKYMDGTDKDYYNALIRYYKKSYKGALIALKLMKKKMDTPEVRIYLLEENIHRAMGNLEKAKIAHNNYINLLTK